MKIIKSHRIYRIQPHWADENPTVKADTTVVLRCFRLCCQFYVWLAKGKHSPEREVSACPVFPKLWGRSLGEVEQHRSANDHRELETTIPHPISLGIVLILGFKWDRGTRQTHLGSYGLFLFCTIILFPYTFHSLPLPKQYIFGQIVEVTVRKDDAAFIVIEVQELMLQLPILIFCAKCRWNKQYKLQFAQLGRH